MSEQVITLSADKLVFILTVSWCCIYVVANTAFQIRLRQLVANHPLNYPESLTAKAGQFANFVTSTFNSLLALATSIHFLPSLIEKGFGAGNQAVNGPNMEGSDVLYLAFIAYVIYDSIYESVLCENPLADWPILFHHLVYLVITCMLYQTQSFPLLAFVLFCQELSTPFLNIMHAMKIFSKEASPYFTVNAWSLTISFFIFRAILPGLAIAHIFVKPPLAWTTANIVIISFVAAGYLMQLFWFNKILKGLLKHLANASESAKAVEQPADEESAALLNADVAAGGSQ